MSDAAELKKHVKQLQNASSNEVRRLGVAFSGSTDFAFLGTRGYPKGSQERLSGQRSASKGRHFCPA